MKISRTLLAALAASAFAFSPLAIQAQDDQGAPPPPMDNGAPPPPDQSAPPDQEGPPDQSGPPDQGGDSSGASFDEFYNDLSSQGQWIQTPDYGYAFQPTVTDPNWAPYTDGHWVYTDYGWTWATDEPWGWATYHYGRWVNIVGTGWVWVPGYQWAPAWVSWRWGGGYCGWAPLPPATFVGVEFGGGGINLGFDFLIGNECDTEFGIGPACYNFIPAGYIGNPYYHGYYVPHSHNFVIINNTRNVTNIYISRHPTPGAFSAVRVGGPTLAEVNGVSRTPVQQVRLAAAGQAGAGTLSGGTLSVFRPRINPATAHSARPATVARTLSTVQVNRGTSVTQPLQVNSRFKPAAPSASAIAAARTAQAHAPKYVATSTRVAPTISATTLQRQQTQSVARAQTEALARQHASTAGTQYRAPSTTESAERPSSGGSSSAGSEAEREQAMKEQQEREASTQQHEQAERQEQERQAAAAQQEREEATRQEQAQTEQREAMEQHASQERESSSYAPQHITQSPQPQVHEQIPQQHSYAPGGGGGPQQHSGGGGGNGQNKNQNNNGQGPGH